MRIEWSEAAEDDVVRLVEFLRESNLNAALRLAQRLMLGPEKLLDLPRMGARLEKYADSEVRRILLDAYEIRYELTGDIIYILRIFHTREDR